jgi:nicotinamidase-related amidase
LDAKAALVAIDLQKGIVGMPTVQPGMEIVAKVARLAQAFRAQNLPVVLVNVAGRAPGRTQVTWSASSFPKDWADLVPELNRQPSDYLVTKQRVGAFLGTQLDSYLREQGVTQIFLTGIATSGGVEATGRSAYDLGYSVVYVADAMTDRDADNHRHSVEKTFPRMGETCNTDDVLAALK